MTLVFCPTHRYAEMLFKETCTWSLYKMCSFKTIGTDILPTIQRYLLELLVTFGGDSSCEQWQKWYDDLLTWFYSHQLCLIFCALSTAMIWTSNSWIYDATPTGSTMGFVSLYGLLLWTFVLEEDFWKRRASLIYRLENYLLISVSQLFLCSSCTIHEATSSSRTHLGLSNFTVRFRAFQPGCRKIRLSEQAKFKLVLKCIFESASSQWSRRVMSARESNVWAFLTKCGIWWKRCNFSLNVLICYWKMFKLQLMGEGCFLCMFQFSKNCLAEMHLLPSALDLLGGWNGLQGSWKLTK